MNEQFNTGTDTGYIKALDQLHYFKSKGAIIEIVEKKQTRSTLQNRALHLFFTWCATALNDSQNFYKYFSILNEEVEIEWTGEMVKEYIWKPIQKVLYDIDSTTRLKTNEIDPILDIITRHLSNKGISISFPNQFDLWLKKAEHY